VDLPQQTRDVDEVNVNDALVIDKVEDDPDRQGQRYGQASLRLHRPGYRDHPFAAIDVPPVRFLR
jgi:hypothetical protein